MMGETAWEVADALPYCCAHPLEANPVPHTVTGVTTSLVWMNV